MPASNIDLCKRMCALRGFGAFLVWSGTAYFRAQAAAECRANLIAASGTILYIRSPGSDDMKPVDITARVSPDQEGDGGGHLLGQSARMGGGRMARPIQS